MAEASPDAINTVPCHLDGITRLCFSPDGETIFTGGVDSLVRIHKADEPDSEPGFYDDHTDEITSLSCSDTHLITASKDNISRIFTYPENTFQGFLTRATAVPIRWVSVDKSGERVAVCSDDLLVKIVNVHDTTKVSFLSDNTRSVRSAAWDPEGKKLVTAGCDGRVKIYDMSAATAVQLRNIEGIISPSEPESETSCYAAWHPSGDSFALALRTNDIGIFSKGTWQKSSTFSQDGHKSVSAYYGNRLTNQPISELAWSPNGRYLASSAGPQILVWALETRTVIARHTHSGGAICGLTWSPTKNLLAYTSLDGSFTRWSVPVGREHPSPIASEQQEKRRVERMLDEDGDVDMDERGEELGDDAEEGDWIVDDDGGYADEGEKWGKGRTEVVNVTKAQESFVPGSTPFRAKKRYLAFNMIGTVDATEVETHQVINVEFHDKSIRRGYHFQDHSGYTMASLGEQGIAYASEATEEGPSVLHYRPYDSWATQADWTLNLPSGEQAACIAVGGPPDGAGLGSVVVATTRGFLRFFTASGVQRYVWRLGEDVVSLAAGRDGLIVVHREGGTSLDGCQNQRYTVMDLESFDILQEGRVPLPRKATLAWLGWSVEGAPIMSDSTGLISLLDKYRRPGQGRWVPVLDGMANRREGKGEWYWPVGMTSSQLSCVILRGKERAPWFPRPLLQEVELHVPLLGMDSQAGKLEESVMRSHLSLNLLSNSLSPDADYDTKAARVGIDKELLQLIQSACKSDNLARALDLARLMLNPGSVDSAAKIAGFYHLGGLEERILDLKGEAAARGRRAERMSKEREKERERRYGADHAAAAAAAGNGAVAAGARPRQGLEFEPRNKPRRSFGGRVRERERERDETPYASTAGKGTVVPETPAEVDETQREEYSFAPPRGGSPDGKRKRAEGDGANGAAKNPFAKKAAGTNPFAKPAVARPLDAIKSTSFFERVDDIEMTGAPKGDKAKNGANGSSANGGGKQATLLGMGMKKPGPRPAPAAVHATSAWTETETEAETEGDGEEEGRRARVLVEETMVASPVKVSESMAAAREEEGMEEAEEEEQEQVEVREGSPDWAEEEEEGEGEGVEETLV